MLKKIRDKYLGNLYKKIRSYLHHVNTRDEILDNRLRSIMNMIHDLEIAKLDPLFNARAIQRIYNLGDYSLILGAPRKYEYNYQGNMAKLFGIRADNVASTDLRRFEFELKKRPYPLDEGQYLTHYAIERGTLRLTERLISYDDVALILKDYTIENDKIIQQMLDKNYNVPDNIKDIEHNLMLLYCYLYFNKDLPNLTLRNIDSSLMKFVDGMRALNSVQIIRERRCRHY